MHSRFQPGVSGNSKGRPKGPSRIPGLPYDDVLSQLVTIHENGVPRRERADRAFVLFITNRGLAGDTRIGRYALKALERNRAAHPPPERPRVIMIAVYPDPGDVDQAMCDLGMARWSDRCGPNASLFLEPWVVQAHLDQMADHTLSKEEQAVVVAATRMPHRVRWPAWWVVGWKR